MKADMEAPTRPASQGENRKEDQLPAAGDAVVELVVAELFSARLEDEVLVIK